MTDVGFEQAEFTRHDDHIVARFRLTLDNHVEEVWAALTQPEQLPQWLAPGEIAPQAGGEAHLDFGESGIVIRSAVTAYEPPRLLEYSWSGPGEPVRPLRWEVEPIGAMSVLTLTLTTPAGEDPGRAAAGWAAHLEMLAAALAGAPIRFPFEVFKAARDTYREQVGALVGEIA
ncbi:SRPBCC family protein [Caulobacter sp. KR2-114]|uniref:SRPBCC family protein n=1 Tax=Caulobacter sp. KR2-114 TaxID=3400912 RepID=UPI003C081C98